MSRTYTRIAMICLTLVGIVGLLSAISRAMGNDLTTVMESQPKLEVAFALMLMIPVLWAIGKMRKNVVRSLMMLAVCGGAVVILLVLGHTGIVEPGESGSGDSLIAKAVPIAVLIAFLLVTTLYERKRNKDIAKGYVMRFGLAFKKCCDGYDVVSEDGCSMRNTPYGVEFYDAQGNPTAFKAADIAAKWKIVKEVTE